MTSFITAFADNAVISEESPAADADKEGENAESDSLPIGGIILVTSIFSLALAVFLAIRSANKQFG